MTNQMIASCVITLALLYFTLDYWIPNLFRAIWRLVVIVVGEHMILPLLDWLIGDGGEGWRADNDSR